MRIGRFVFLLVMLGAAALSAAAQRDGGPPVAGQAFAGVWAGSWEGAGGAGGFTLTLERDKDKGVVGKVSVTGEPTYDATLTSVAFDDKKMIGRYDFTPDPAAAEVVLGATFDGEAVAGTWSLREKGGGTEVASGTWKATRKPAAP